MLVKNESLAEMIGIILGDGRLRWDPVNRHYQLDIILNYIDERDYVFYVKNYLNSLFKMEPKISRQINEDGTEGKGIYLTIYNKNLVEDLISLGLMPGNKVENQVCVPKWIKSNKAFVIACLRGLFDTDGSVFPVLKENAIKLNFKNGSFPLIEDFKEMCESLKINTSKISPYEEISEKTGKISITYIIQIQARDQVKKFLDIVKPMKWIFKKDELLAIVKNPFDYRMQYYTVEDVKIWISLYKELKSYNAVRDFLKIETINPPRIETIRLRIKNFLGENYEEWLNQIKKK